MEKYTFNFSFFYLFTFPRKEIRSLIPPLEPLYTVQQSMKAILGEQEMICIPRIMYIAFIARA